MEWRFGITNRNEMAMDIALDNGRHVELISRYGEIDRMADLHGLTYVQYADDFDGMKALARCNRDKFNVFARDFKAFDYADFKEHWFDAREWKEYARDMPRKVLEFMRRELPKE